MKKQRQALGLDMARHLVIQSDNTVSACKNAEWALFLATLQRRSNFDSIHSMYLREGHTHEDVDMVFSLVFSRVLRRNKIKRPEELLRSLEGGMGPLMREKGYEVEASHVTHIRNFSEWLAPMEIHAYNAFRKRQKVDVPHSFSYKFRMDLTADEQRWLELEPTDTGFAKHPLDVFLISTLWLEINDEDFLVFL